MIGINLARRLDRRLGQPLCRLLGLTRFVRRKRHLPAPDRVKKVLVVKMWGMGSIVLASPVFRHLREHMPHAEIHFLTLTQNKRLYEGYVDQVLCFELSSWKAAFLSTLRIVRWLRRERVEVVIDLELASRVTAMLCYLSPGSLTVGYAPTGSGKDLFDITIPYHESVHISQIFLRAIDALGLPVGDARPVPFPEDEEAEAEATTFLAETQLSRFVVLNPNTSDMAPERAWPGSRFVELTRLIRERWSDVGVVFIGAPADRERVAGLLAELKDMEGVFSAAGVTSIRGTAALIGHAQALVSNDSGPMHLGVMRGVPTIGLFGPETPVLYGPLGPNHVALSSYQPCSPCLSIYNDKSFICTRNAICMKAIEVEADVLAALAPMVSAPYPLEVS